MVLIGQETINGMIISFNQTSFNTYRVDLLDHQQILKTRVFADSNDINETTLTGFQEANICYHTLLHLAKTSLGLDYSSFGLNYLVFDNK